MLLICDLQEIKGDQNEGNENAVRAGCGGSNGDGNGDASTNTSSHQPTLVHTVTPSAVAEYYHFSVTALIQCSCRMLNDKGQDRTSNDSDITIAGYSIVNMSTTRWDVTIVVVVVVAVVLDLLLVACVFGVACVVVVVVVVSIVVGMLLLACVFRVVVGVVVGVVAPRHVCRSIFIDLDITIVVVTIDLVVVVVVVTIEIDITIIHGVVALRRGA